MAKVVTFVEMIEEWNEATYRPSGQRVAATFQRRNAARQGGSGSWLAPVGATSSASLLLSALASLGLVAFLWVAPTLKGRLRYSALKISTCLYLSYMVNKIQHSSTSQGQSVAGKMYTLLEFGTQPFFMMFNSLAFAGFLVAVFAGYWLLGGRRKAQNLFLSAARQRRSKNVDIRAATAAWKMV